MKEPCFVDVRGLRDVAARRQLQHCIETLLTRYVAGSAARFVTFRPEPTCTESCEPGRERPSYILRLTEACGDGKGAASLRDTGAFVLHVQLDESELSDCGQHEKVVLTKVMPKLMRLIPCADAAACSSIVRVVRGFFKPTRRDADPLFVDVLPLLSNPRAFQWLLDEGQAFIRALSWSQADKRAGRAGETVTAVVALETRGFMFGSSLAARMGLSFVPLRRSGTYPGRLIIRQEFTNIAGLQCIEVDGCVLGHDERVVLVDDLLASGASLLAASSLLRAANVRVQGAFVPIEIGSMNGRLKLHKYQADWPVHSVMQIVSLRSAPRIESMR